jgi:acyl-CoA thioester hydrolase
MGSEDPTLHYTVCYADTDAGGVVYHARYIDMVERARNKLMYAAGFTFAMLAEQYQVMLIVHRVEAVYHAPAVLEDRLQLRSRLTDCRAARSVWVTDVTRDDVLIASITIEIVALHTVTRRLARHPEAFLERLSPYLVPA